MSDSHFAADWLGLREPVDHRARAPNLEHRLAKLLRDRTPPWRIVDLGAGTGSNPRHLAPRLPGPQAWRLVDQDPRLLDQARVALQSLGHPAGHALAFENDARSLASIEDVLDSDCDLVTASALLDLASAEWISSLAAGVARLQCPLLIVLSVDGDWHFIEPDGRPASNDVDRRMQSHYLAHQRRDKGLGAALGGTAPGQLAERLRQRGFRVVMAASPWQMHPGRHVGLARQLLAGWSSAIEVQSPDLTEEVRDWATRRDRELAAGRLGVAVGHVDLLAWPP